jgi:hypothetical protein
LLEVDGALGLVLVALWIHAIVDVVRADERRVRHLPKGTWLFLVMSLPDVGALIWMVAGRPERPLARSTEYLVRPPRRRPLGPEDRPEFTAWLHQQVKVERDHRREVPPPSDPGQDAPPAPA